MRCWCRWENDTATSGSPIAATVPCAVFYARRIRLRLKPGGRHQRLVECFRDGRIAAGDRRVPGTPQKCVIAEILAADLTQSVKNPRAGHGIEPRITGGSH